MPHDPNAVFAQLRERCAGIADEQLRLAESLTGDGKYWFAKVYHHVTAHELQMIDEGRYTYPIMKMQEVVAFLTWLGSENFIFLGARDYELSDDEESEGGGQRAGRAQPYSRLVGG